MQFRRFLLPPAACASLTALAQQRDVVYGCKDGTALVLDVFTPARLNGAGVPQLISGGMRSNLTASRPRQVRRQTQALPDAGYAVFAVFHGSRPRYTVPEISRDIARAARFVAAGAWRCMREPLASRELRRRRIRPMELPAACGPWPPTTLRAIS